MNPSGAAPAGDVPRSAVPFSGIAMGCDYNPEQWPREVWREDVALMREAGVEFVTLGVFSWGLLQPEPGRCDFGWFDEVLGLLHGGGIAVDLATATAAPPPWLTTATRRSCPSTPRAGRSGRAAASRGVRVRRSSASTRSPSSNRWPAGTAPTPPCGSGT